MAGAFQILDPRDLLVSTENVTNTVWENNSPTLTLFVPLMFDGNIKYIKILSYI